MIFAVQIFFIVFREALEAAIVMSVLLSFLKQCLGQPGQDMVLYKRLVKQVWMGAAIGLGIALAIGAIFIGVFYGVGKDLWAKSEDLWEGVFLLIASIIVSIMGLALLRINKMQEKWKLKIAESMSPATANQGWFKWLGEWGRRNSMLLLPLITVLREGLEGVVFVGGVSLSLPAKSFPLPVITGCISGMLIGYFMYRGGNAMSIQIFLIASTCVLYLIGAGMFSRAVWSFEMYEFARRVGGDVAETGSGPGSYNINTSVWHVNCCSPNTDHGWDIFNALLGWQNSATYGSVISYNLYWAALIVAIVFLMYEERTGSMPLGKQTINFLGKIPGLRKWAAKKKDQSLLSGDAALSQAARQHAGVLQSTA
ncbi:high-affinity iron permease-like protein [Ceratocystis lukuohia]|uniref:Plasma membrane iron permease n=3 Tax=Ceratocystis TaxID=5157 RepID=A0A0F8B5K8_CERFI|nr:Plasma membrane iron permease [Ceratocystis platani]PHH50298.1 Plasma membrane iron permease [Ceratocystis fimbriata CBS 114723]